MVPMTVTRVADPAHPSETPDRITPRYDPSLTMESLAMLPSPHPAVVFRTVSDGAVLLHTELEIYFGLNSVGSRVWQLLPPGSRNLDDLCSSLRETYPDVAAEDLRADVVELLGHLRENLLVVEPW